MIYTVQVGQKFSDVKLDFLNREEALAVYTKLKIALDEYEPYKNLDTQTIEVDGYKGMHPAVFKLSDMQHVFFGSVGDEAMLAAKTAVMKKEQDALVEAGILLKNPLPESTEFEK
jgi:hypothetical protein